MSQTSVVVHPDADAMAQATAARLIVRLIDAQSHRGTASVVLTGGRGAAAIYAAVRDSPARDAVDWSKVDLWWGDERFLPSGDPERNETQARAALLDAVPLDPARVHPMPASDGPDGDDPEAAAGRYSDELALAGRAGSPSLPPFDLVLLGVGEDGHIASVFPEHPAAYDTRTVTAVRGAPKPPPVRITLTQVAINTATEVWLIAAGAGKAGAVGLAMAGGGPVQLPAAGVQGLERTLWLLDREAARDVSPRLRSLR
ncbi:6-phosphogluconolactonase [Luedemannella flava]|uniref:6-phosphogluconolactonase n=1 Tax=Luedemannella flava TaxID=349316 RepID=A0ABN2LM47_9ACTN